MYFVDIEKAIDKKGDEVSDKEKSLPQSFV